MRLVTSTQTSQRVDLTRKVSFVSTGTGSISRHQLPSTSVNQRWPEANKIKWLPVLSLLFLFSASMLGSFASKFTGAGDLSVKIQAAAFLVVLIPAAMRSRQESLPVPSHYVMTLICIVVYTTLLTYYQTAAASMSVKAEVAMINKTLGLALALLSIVLGVRIFRSIEVRAALILFALSEITLVFTAKALGMNFNANNLGMRMAVSGLVLFALTKHKLGMLSYVLLVACLSFTFSLQCRTAIVAALGATVLLGIEKYTRRQRATAAFIAIFFLGGLFFALPTIHSVTRELAVQSLGSSNPIAQFFLSDKNKSKIDNDYFDRMHVWDHVWKRIERRPIFGHGLGTEQALMGIRSHNAFLSLMYEGGVVLLALWLTFYIPAGRSVLAREESCDAANDSLDSARVLLLSYMVLAGLLESSGLASIASPINVIFMFLTLHFSCQRKQVSAPKLEMVAGQKISHAR